jgi:hypothetical protein
MMDRGGLSLKTFLQTSRHLGFKLWLQYAGRGVFVISVPVPAPLIYQLLLQCLILFRGGAALNLYATLQVGDHCVLFV